MQTAHRFLSAAVLALLSASSYAATIYTTSASFLAQVAPGSYTETFTGLANPPSGSVSFSGGAFAYSAFAPSAIYLAGGFLGTNQQNEVLTITFNGGNIFAVGANFYATDIADAFHAVSMSISLSDGTVETFTPSSLSESYRGFVSHLAVTSLIWSVPARRFMVGSTT